MRVTEDLRANGIAAAALFKPSLGGWIVQIFPGGIRQRPARRPADQGPPRANARANAGGRPM
jgi:hypothetical protein